MKKLILQTHTDIQNSGYGYDEYSDRCKKSYQLFDASRTSIEKYAKKYNVDYHCVINNPFFSHYDNGPGIATEKMRIVSEEYQEYEQILVLDTDIYIRDDAPNIFETYANHEFVIRGHTDKTDLMKNINSGVVLWSQKVINKIRPHVLEWRNNPTDIAVDDELIQLCYSIDSWNVTDLDRLYNRFAKEHYIDKQPAAFIHYGADSWYGDDMTGLDYFNTFHYVHNLVMRKK